MMEQLRDSYDIAARVTRRWIDKQKSTDRLIAAPAPVVLMSATGMATIDFDFQRYVERRKGRARGPGARGRGLRLRRRPARAAHARSAAAGEAGARGDGAAVAVGGARRAARGAVKVSQREQPAVYALGERCAERLHIAAPTIYVALGIAGARRTPSAPTTSATSCSSGGLVDELTEAELADVIGHECGHIQNNHVLPSTALYYLVHFASRFVRWIVAPAVMALRSWSRRAEITCDRAGLLCTRDVDVSAAALPKSGVGARVRRGAARVRRERILPRHDEAAGRHDARGVRRARRARS